VRPSRRIWLLPAVAVVFFHLAYLFPGAGWAVVGYVGGLLIFARHVPTPRQAFYGGLAAGVAAIGPWMGFLLGIFGPTAVVLWAIVASWTGLFVLLARYAYLRLLPSRAAVVVPVLWTGLEYFRCELYPLKFTWLTPGFAIAPNTHGPFPTSFGVCGIGFVMSAALSAMYCTPRKRQWVPVLGLLLLTIALRPSQPDGSQYNFRVAGLQLEGVDTDGIPRRLDALLREYPETNLVVLPEYTFAGPVSDAVCAWCRRNRKFLVAGGMELLKGDEFRNTAFVIGPNGKELFRQVKSVPIQFFKDGLPATEQGIWESPWGKVGICICYDLSYTRVVDRLVEMGAQVIVAPTMDARHWGESQHRLHARIAPVRAAEYGVPIVRVCSSGISQIVDGEGKVIATAPFPGEGASIAAEVRPALRGRLPWDRWVAPFCTGLTGAWMAWALVDALRARLKGRGSTSTP
jgi:apolipoprotein N-acyltransferase